MKNIIKTYSSVPGEKEGKRNIICPVCGSNAFKSKWQIEKAVFSECPGCGLILQNPQPVSADLKARYNIKYFNYELENEENFFNLMIRGLNDIKFFQQVAPSIPGKEILDVGCATGRLLNHFKKSGWHTAGVELCIESADYGNRKYNVGIIPSTIEKASFSDNSFSFIHASHVIEHVPDPDMFVKEIYRILKPGGAFVCVTPSSASLQACLFRKNWRSAIPDHLFLFNKRNLAELLGKNGLYVDKVKTWGGLAAGSVPLPLKKLADKSAKIFNCGDVVLLLARK